MNFDLSLTAVPGLLVGHAHDAEALTGCTVILCPQGATGGVDQRGGAPGTRETDLLRPMHWVQQVHAILLTGGSAFGLDAAGGVMRWLEERNFGFDVYVARVPIVPAAVIFDLAIGRAGVRPDAEMGYQACEQANAGPVSEGSVGAGMGATVGKILGMDLAMKSGLGSAAIDLGGGLLVGALAVVNALGDVIDPSSGAILAGARRLPTAAEPQAHFADSLAVLGALAAQPKTPPPAGQNTVIGVVATNARLTKEQANHLAQMAQGGLARAIRPAHTLLDGDTIFALSTGEIEADLTVLGAFAAEAFTAAILRGVRAAQPAGGLPSANNLMYR